MKSAEQFAFIPNKLRLFFLAFLCELQLLAYDGV